MKTLLSGNSAVAMFHNINEQGKNYARLHIYNRLNNEWIYDSFIMVKSEEAGFEITHVDVKGSFATVHTQTSYATGKVFFEKKGDNWVFKGRERRRSGQPDGYSRDVKPWMYKLYNFLGLNGSISYQA